MTLYSHLRGIGTLQIIGTEDADHQVAILFERITVENGVDGVATTKVTFVGVSLFPRLGRFLGRSFTDLCGGDD